MKKEMLINVLQPEECRIAILEDGVLEELYVERTSHESYVGNIYKGRVVNIEPSIQAAFVDFGVGRNGFLHVSDVEPAYYKHLEQRRFEGRGERRGNGPDRGPDSGRDRDRGGDRDRGRGRGGPRGQVMRRRSVEPDYPHEEYSPEEELFAPSEPAPEVAAPEQDDLFGFTPEPTAPAEAPLPSEPDPVPVAEAAPAEESAAE